LFTLRRDFAVLGSSPEVSSASAGAARELRPIAELIRAAKIWRKMKDLRDLIVDPKERADT